MLLFSNYGIRDCIQKFEPSFTFVVLHMATLNSWNKLTYSEIITQLNLTNADIIRLLHSFSSPKFKYFPRNQARKPSLWLLSLIWFLIWPTKWGESRWWLVWSFFLSHALILFWYLYPILEMRDEMLLPHLQVSLQPATKIDGASLIPQLSGS